MLSPLSFHCVIPGAERSEADGESILIALPHGPIDPRFRGDDRTLLRAACGQFSWTRSPHGTGALPFTSHNTG